jgi:hypothetical protein
MFLQASSLYERHLKVKVKLSHYMLWKCMGREEVWLLQILNLGTRWG